MTINKKGGKKHKKTKNVASEGIERELTFKTDGQEYAQVLRLLGNCRLELFCIDGKKRLGIIRGSMKKKVWIKVNDLVLVSLRPFEDAKCDILFKYDLREVNRLKDLDEIPKTLKIGEEDGEGKEDIGVDFKEEGEESDEDDDLQQKKRYDDLNIDLI